MQAEYVEAFNLYLSEATVRDKVFTWLQKVLEKLCSGETEEDLKRAVKKVFVAQFTKKKNKKSADTSSVAEAAALVNNTNHPIGRFKVAVC
jgi:hypothetical protein